MQKKFPDAEVFEIKKIELNSPIIFAGFVGAGLVGPLAINHIIEKLKMRQIAVMRSIYLHNQQEVKSYVHIKTAKSLFNIII